MGGGGVAQLSEGGGAGRVLYSLVTTLFTLLYAGLNSFLNIPVKFIVS